MSVLTLLFILLLSSTVFTNAASWNAAIQNEYPPGSLACKWFNETVLDCSRRDLSIIPTIDQHNATIVNLSDNKLELISPIVFAGQIQLTSLDFSKNQLLNITGSPFSDLSSLVFLILNHNQLSYLAPTAFAGLHNLKKLNIIDNKLKAVPDDIFRDLDCLETLDLATNQLTEVPSSALSTLCNLKALYLVFNPFTSVTFGREFESLTKLTYFAFSSYDLKTSYLTKDVFQYLTQIPLRYVQFACYPNPFYAAGSFESLQHIEDLLLGTLSQTNIVKVSSSVRSLRLALHKFNLTTNSFRPLSNLNESLTHFFLTVVYITKIEDCVFKWFPSLLHLDLDLTTTTGRMLVLSDDAFLGLNKLEFLAISNKLTTIPSATFKAFAQTGSLKRLDLSGNSLTGVFPPNAFASVTSLEHLDLSFNPIKVIDKWIDSLTNLTHLFLNGGNTQNFAVYEWNTPLYSLIEVHLDHLSNEDLPPFLWDLNLSEQAPNLEILNVADTKNIYRLSTIQNLTSLRDLDVSGSLTMLAEDKLFKEWSFICYPNLESLKFARNKLKTMTKLNLHKTTPGEVFIDLSVNEISAVDENIQLLLNLQHINLNNNQISSLDNIHNLVRIKSLKIAQNVINSVSASFVKTLTESKLEYLDLRNNPFECTCTIMPFQNWILDDKRVYLEPGIYRCDSPRKVQDLSLTQVKLDCRSYFGVHVAIAASCSLLAALMVILAWRYRWHLRYRFFLLCNWHRMRYDDIERQDGDDFEMVEVPRYDAFVSYAHQSDNDLEWVLNEMRPNLEEGPEPLRLCIGQARDFIPGTNLFDSITDAIHHSRKTIVVLSPSYVDSELCYFETQHAWKRLIEESRDVLIMILLEPIPDDKMTIWLRQLLCKKGYLKWPHGRAGHQLFWRCVRKKIKKRTLVNRRFDA